MSIKIRLTEVLNYSGLKNPALEKKTGIKKESWGALRNGRIRVNEDHLEVVNQLWPEFAYWVMTGKENPANGDISPNTEEVRKNYKRPDYGKESQRKMEGYVIRN